MRRMHSSMAAESGGGGKLARFPASFASSEALRAGPGHTSGGRVHLWGEGRRAVSVRQAFSRWPPSSTARAARGSARRGPGAGRRWPAAPACATPQSHKGARSRGLARALSRAAAGSSPRWPAPARCRAGSAPAAAALSAAEWAAPGAGSQRRESQSRSWLLAIQWVLMRVAWRSSCICLTMFSCATPQSPFARARSRAPRKAAPRQSARRSAAHRRQSLPRGGSWS